MERVETSVLIEASHEQVLSELSPRALVEYEGTFDVAEVEETETGTVIRAIAADQDLETELRFEEIPNGFGYEQGETGPFEELYTSITVSEYDGELPDGVDVDADEEAPARVTMRSRFTFGGRFARIKDWFAASTRREELQRALFNFADDIVDEESERSEASVEND